ncbi:MAG: ECF transporter S component [Oscillospiraceae bacterium]|nr:ECF transporter S component [Oscillospiraceae bacterium]
MGEIFGLIRENLRFFSICLVIGGAVILAAKLAERFLLKHRQVSPARRVTIIGMCTAIAIVLYVMDFPVPFLAPPFYKLDFSEIPVLLCGFFLGPSAGVICLALKVLVKLLLTSTTTAFVGDFANFIVGCTLVLPAVILYHLHKTKRSALVGLVVGTLSMAIFGSAFNAIYLIPEFSRLFGLPLEAIIGMGAEIHPSIDSINRLALLCVAPLNIVKGTAVSVLTMLLYKHVARPLFREK